MVCDHLFGLFRSRVTRVLLPCARSRYLVPPLTTVDLHVERQMRMSVERLIYRIEHPQLEPVLEFVKPNLVERSSVKNI